LIAYIVRKLLTAVPLVLGVITLIFVLVELSPGDATDRFFTPETPPEVRQLIEQKWGLDRSPVERYFIMLGNMASGSSTSSPRPCPTPSSSRCSPS
jgi:peptide/nickel transport system permease protein